MSLLGTVDAERESEDNGRSRQMRHDRAVGAISEDGHYESLLGDVVATVIANRLKWLHINTHGVTESSPKFIQQLSGIDDVREAIAIRDRIVAEIDTALAVRLGLRVRG